MPAKGEGELERGDRLRIETPGGGGFGSEFLDAPDGIATRGRLAGQPRPMSHGNGVSAYYN